MTHDVYTHGHHEAVLRSHTWRTAENSAGYLLAALRPGLELLDVGLVEIQLRHGLVDLRVGQDPELGAPDHEGLDLFEFLKFRYRHHVPFFRRPIERYPTGVDP